MTFKMVHEYLPFAYQMEERARRSVMQSYNVLTRHKKAHRAAVKALEGGHSLSVVVRACTIV
jgi:hypothetical protein